MSKLAKLNPLPAIASLFYPSHCAVCAEPIEPNRSLCDTCMQKAPRIKPPFCAVCSEPFAGEITQSFSCANCANRYLHFECAVSAYRSRGVVRKVVHDFKYGHQTRLRHVVADWLMDALDDPRLADRQFDLIVAAPLHPRRKRERGFNQAELLAELLSKRTGIALHPALERIRYTTTQTAFDREERMQNLHDAFRLRKKAHVRGLRVLLLDDVLTTGSTLSECARVLKSGGALSVHGITGARA